MYQVILVDDEFYVRKSIQNRVDWAKLGCEIVAEADNGLRALELVGALKPDIVLVDIMMPEMDGLELIRRAREITPYSQFAILSGYDDFLYTKEAIKLKVIDYIKKPVDVAELEQAVREMIHLIETNSQARQHYTRLVDQAKDLTELRIEHALNDVCSSPDAYPAIQGLLKDSTYAWMVVYSSPGPESSAARGPDGAKAYITRCLEQAVCSKQTGAEPCYLVTNEADANEIRILIPAEDSEIVQKAAENLFQSLKTSLCNEPEWNISLAYSKPAPVRGLYDQYVQTLAILKFKLFFGRYYILNSDVLKAPAQNEVKAVFSLLENVKRCIASRQFHKLDHILTQLFSEKLITSPQVLEDALFYLYGLFREYAVRYNSKLPEPYAQKMTGTHAILQYEDLLSVREEVRSLLYRFFCDGCPIDDEHITTQVKKYIEENYHEHIGLKSIAGLFYLNASYLSSLFKRKTGVNLNKYIETVRIEHAKNLLASLDIPVNDVSSMIGYSDPNYFTKAFRKRTGKTPLEYRANNT